MINNNNNNNNNNIIINIYVVIIVIIILTNNYNIVITLPLPLGFLSFFFGRASWYFTDVLIVQLCSVIIFKKFFLTVWKMHFIVWTVNIILQILPYTSGAYYGRSISDVQGIPIIRCFIAHPSDVDNAVYWNNVVMNSQLILSFIIIVVFTSIIIIYSCFIDKSNTVIREHTNDTISTIIWYPLAMLVAFVPGALYAFVVNKYIDEHGHPPFHGIVIANILLASNGFYGCLLSLIFYIKTKQAINEWYQIFYKTFYNAQVYNDDDTIGVSTNLSEVIMSPLSYIKNFRIL